MNETTKAFLFGFAVGAAVMYKYIERQLIDFFESDMVTFVFGEDTEDEACES